MARHKHQFVSRRQKRAIRRMYEQMHFEADREGWIREAFREYWAIKMPPQRCKNREARRYLRLAKESYSMEAYRYRAVVPGPVVYHPESATMRITTDYATDRGIVTIGPDHPLYDDVVERFGGSNA